MANAQSVVQVQQNLPSWASTLPANPWTDVYIASILDSNNGNVFSAIRLFWVQRVSDTQPLTDVHDANSSRPLSQNHEHAVRMLVYWDNFRETNHVERSRKIKRRWKHRRGSFVGVDQYGWGSPYARTD